MSNQSVAVKYLNAEQLSNRWAGAVAVGTLANWRSRKIGPPFVKFRSKVLYPIADLEAWEAEQGMASLQAV